MYNFICSECKHNFSFTEDSHCDDVQCPLCKIWLSVYEGEDEDLNMHAWVTGIAKRNLIQ